MSKNEETVGDDEKIAALHAGAKAKRRGDDLSYNPHSVKDPRWGCWNAGWRHPERYPEHPLSYPEIKIDLSSPIAEAERNANTLLRSKLDNVSKNIVSRLLMSGKDYQGTEEGLAHEILRKKIEEYVLSDTFAAKIDEIIDAEMTAAAAHAVRTLLASQSRKYLFRATERKKKEMPDGG